MAQSFTDVSLKAVHLVFVSVLTLLAFGCAGWAFSAGKVAYGVGGVIVGILVIIYGIYFLKKLKKMSYL